MSTPSVEHRVPASDDGGSHRGRMVTNWMLAVVAVLGALAVIGFAYLQVLGTAACTDRACGGMGPSELGFSLILYGTPVVALVGLIVSFFTARRRWGIVVPAISWAVVVLSLIVLLVTF